MVVGAKEERTTLSKPEAMAKMLEGKLQERLEKARLSQQYPAFDIVETDTGLFKSEISSKTGLQGFKILDSHEKGDTLLMTLSVSLGDSLSTAKELIRAQLLSKMSTVAGEQLLIREIKFENTNSIKTREKR